MEHYEMAEKLAEKAGVSMEAAKDALEAANWDMLDAMILLEKAGKTEKKSGTYETTGQPEEPKEEPKAKRSSEFKTKAENAGSRIKRFCVDNRLAVYNKEGERLINCPVIIPILLLLIFSWWTLLAVGLMLLFGLRIRFEGPELGKKGINDFMDKAGAAAQNVKQSIVDEVHTDKEEKKEDTE